MRTTILLTLILLSQTLFSQHVPVPASASKQGTVIKGATIHIGNGQVIENGVIAIENGKIKAVNQGTDREIFEGFKEIDATGKHIYPGFIAPSSNLGLTEIGAVRPTRDFDEVGNIIPNVRSIIAYNTDSEIIPTVRAMGVLTIQTTPQGGRISGTSSIVHLDAWNWEDAAYKTDDGVHLNWPRLYSWSWRNRTLSKNESYNEQLKEVEDFFQQAAAYAKKGNAERTNLKFEAMRGIFDGTKKLFIHADYAKAIQSAVLFCKKQGIKPVIIGGRDSYLITAFLKKNAVPVILGNTHSLPRREQDDIDQPFKTAAQLQKAGVLFCFAQPGANWQLRNLGFQAGQAVGHGLDYETAIKALTSNTAKILGIDKTVGTLEAGKDATLFISEGDPLDMRTAKLTDAFIQGRQIELDNKQEMLYRKFQKKYRVR